MALDKALANPDVPAWERDRVRALLDCQQYLITRAGTEAVRYTEAFNGVLDPLLVLFGQSDDLANLVEVKADATLIDLARFLVSTPPMSQADLKIIVEGVGRKDRQQKKLAFITQHLRSPAMSATAIQRPWNSRRRTSTQKSRVGA